MITYKLYFRRSPFRGGWPMISTSWIRGEEDTRPGNRGKWGIDDFKVPAEMNGPWRDIDVKPALAVAVQSRPPAGTMDSSNKHEVE